MKRFGIIILAAGPSSRLGTPKQSLVLGDRPLLLRTVDAALGSAGWPVIVVLGANAETIRPLLSSRPVLVAENPSWQEGMASSIRTGITLLGQFSRAIDGALLAVCDQPAFSAAAIAALVQRQAETGASIVSAQYSGRRAVPALFTKDHFLALAALTGEAGARDLLYQTGVHVATVDLPALAMDIDTPADWQQAAQIAAGDEVR